MKAVYEAGHAIPELGIEPGDLVTLRPSHPDNPFIVTRLHPRHRMTELLDHLDRFRPLQIAGASSPETGEAELRRRLQGSPQPPPLLRRRRHLRLAR